MATRAAGLLIGIVFGVMLCWTWMINPDVILGALTFQSSYLFLFMGSAVGTGALGLFILRKRAPKAVLVDAKVAWKDDPFARRHVTGSLMFGIGWGIACVCPGPILAQLGQGIPWALYPFAGAVAGVFIYLRRGSAETEPAGDHAAAPAASAVN